jgi:hypothetical protein
MKSSISVSDATVIVRIAVLTYECTCAEKHDFKVLAPPKLPLQLCMSRYSGTGKPYSFLRKTVLSRESVYSYTIDDQYHTIDIMVKYGDPLKVQFEDKEGFDTAVAELTQLFGK